MRYFKRVDWNGKTTTVESYSHQAPVVGAEEIDQAEHDLFMANLPEPSPGSLPKTLQTQIDELKAELVENGVIS
ncbi:hypothetical protein CMI37_19715 [Candidatus Pacearchaeota archaeon]|nr:hypothetical protein [Candidatus Pacearchaeota archaeon]